MDRDLFEHLVLRPDEAGGSHIFYRNRRFHKSLRFFLGNILRDWRFCFESATLKNMRVGIDISQIVYDGTGAATYTKELVRGLLSESAQDFSLTLFGSSLRQKQKYSEFLQTLPKQVDHKFVSLPPMLLNMLWNDLHILSVDHFLGQTDVFHSSDATQPPTHAKKVTTVHDLVAYHYPETLHPKQLQVQRRRLGWVKAEADCIIAVSEATKKDLIELLQIPEEKIVVIYEGVDSRFNAALRDDTENLQRIRQKYSLPEQYILNVGTIQPRKNLRRLLESYRRLEQSPPLVIAGNGGWGEQLPKMENVMILGYVDQSDLPFLYTGATCFVYPALYEGFGLPVLEAMACSTPVVTSNVSSLPEVGGDAAVYVNPEEVESISQGLASVLSLSEQDYKKMQKKGINQAKKFSWEKCANETLEVYKHLIS